MIPPPPVYTVTDIDTQMVDMSHYFIGYIAHEDSSGKQVTFGNVGKSKLLHPGMLPS
jgi:hypothetical protein